VKRVVGERQRGSPLGYTQVFKKKPLFLREESLFLREESLSS